MTQGTQEQSKREKSVREEKRKMLKDKNGVQGSQMEESL